MKLNNKVSIIIPIYNSSCFLEKCLNSIIGQTYKNIEILLIDDGSTDDSKIICSKYSQFDNRIKYYYNENHGVSYSRNFGLRKCSGNYVCFIDSDDWIDTKYIETMIKYSLEYKTDLVISNAILIKENGKSIDNKLIKDNKIINENEYVECLLSEKFFSSVCWGKLYKKSSIENTYFDEKMRIAEDFKFLYEIKKNIHNVLLIKDELYYYYLRDNSTIRAGFNDKWYDEIEFCSYLYHNTNNSNKDIKSLLLKRMLRVICSCLYEKNITRKEKKRLYSIIKKYYLNGLICNKISLFEKIKLLSLYILPLKPLIILKESKYK